MAADNNLLGEFKLEGFPPMLKGVPQIEVTFDVNPDGILNVAAVETSTGVESTVVITNDRGHLSAKQIGAMVAGEFLVCHHTPTYQCSLT